MKLQIKKATYHIQKSFPWIDIEDVIEIVSSLERISFEEKLTAQDIISIVCEICEDV